MIKRYDVYVDIDGTMYEDVDPEGKWVRFEDVQQACLDSYNYGVADTQEAMQRALGIKHD